MPVTGNLVLSETEGPTMTEAFAAPQPAGQLPAEVTSFVGRRFERSAVRDLLAEFRLVTLTGFGGIGKTRLAMRLASELRRTFRDGVCFVPLGALEEAEEVPDQVADALGLSGRSVQSGTVALVEYLRDRAMLIVLDNCEHVVDAAALMADTLLRACPKVRILATSREPLRVDGEVAHAVASLSVPVGGDEGAHQSEAVQLFVDRARASAPGFALDEGNRAAVAAVCRRLEGIPLAIELAAARLTTLSATELEQGLTDQWELLSRGRRTAPQRQSTMAACIEWSFELCSPAERTLWARAAVFADGFEHDAAQAVCARPDDREPVRETLASLVDKSILATTRSGTTTRFRMLPPIRQRGLAELARIGEADEQRGRHRDFYLGLVAQAHDAWLSSEQLAWIDRIRRELGNIAEVLEHSTTASDEGRRACGDLLEYVHVHGLFRQARRWCERLLAEPGGDPTSRALALRAAAWWAAVQGDVGAARPLLAEGQALADGLGGEPQVLLTQAGGLVAMYAGELDEAESLLTDALQGCTGTGNAAEAAHCWMLLAMLDVLRDNPERALERHRACLAITEPVGETWLRSWSTWAAGLAEADRGDLASGQAALKECLRLEQLMGETMGIGAVLESMAWIIAPAEPERAAVLMGAAQNEWDRIGTSIYIRTSIHAQPGLDVRHQAATATARGLLGDAAFERAWSRGRSLEQADAVALCLERETRSRLVAAPAAGKQVLTRRERQIAELVRQGLSNQEIADALVISRRTAEGHVEHILTKLGFTSRTQVAAWMGEQSSAGATD